MNKLIFSLEFQLPRSRELCDNPEVGATGGGGDIGESGITRWHSCSAKSMFISPTSSSEFTEQCEEDGVFDAEGIVEEDTKQPEV